MISFVILVLAVAFSGHLKDVAAWDIVPPIPVDIPAPGIRRMPATPTPKINIEIFIDVICPDSFDAWPILKQVQDHYGNNNLDLIVQQMPLPYHRNAFMNTQGLYVIERNNNTLIANRVFEYIETSLSMWSNFSTSNTVNKTQAEVLDMLADMAVLVTGISKAEFVSSIGSYDSLTRHAWKFAAKRGVSNTPAFFSNGVELGTGMAVPTYNDWLTYLDPLMNP